MRADSSGSQSGNRVPVRDQEVVGSNPTAPTTIYRAFSGSRNRSESSRGHVGAGCAAALPFDRAPLDRPIERYSGAVWASWSTGSASGAVISEDDHGRAAKGFRNRWRYTITGPAVIGVASGCSLHWVRVQVLQGGTLSVDFDEILHLLIVPGDPEIQSRFARNAGTCEGNLQFVNVESTDGRWRITIEEPTAMPETRTFCR